MLIERRPGYPLFDLVICDFGLALVGSGHEVTVEGKAAVNIKGFSPRYAAPEVFVHSRLAHIALDLHQEQKSDIYAFGVVIWEILTRILPWEGYKASDVEIYVRQGMRPSPVPQFSDPRLKYLVDLLQICWRPSQADRPRANDIVQRLDVLIT